MTLIKIPYKNVQDIFNNYTVSESSVEIAQLNSSPLQFIQALEQAQQWHELMLFFAHALPQREALWWGYCCASYCNHWQAAEKEILNIAQRWITNSSESERYNAQEMVKIVGLENGAGWLAQAIFWSEGSMLSPDDPSILAPPFLYAQALAGCVDLCALLPESDQTEDKYHRFCLIGLNIANGGNGSV